MRRLVFGFFLALSVLPALGAHTQVRLVLSHESARPGEVITAGIHLKMDAGWHTYWRNGGDSGAPTTIDWSLPKGVTAGEIQWPLPEKYSVEGETTFIYHDEVVLLVPLKLDASLQPGKLQLRTKVAWLECEKACVPGEATVESTLAIGDTKPSADAQAFKAWREKIPLPKPDSDARARWESAAKGDSRPLLIEWTAEKLTKEADFFPYADEEFTLPAATETVRLADGEARLRKAVTKLSGWPQQVSGVIIERGEGGKLLGAYEVKLPVTASPGPPNSKPKAAGRAEVPEEEEKTLLAWIGIAFLGGLILNLMPCVLPVIALKIFGFVAQGNESPQRVRRLGLIYGLGVLCSFLVMAAVVIGLQGAGKQTSWGMQFGSPYFIVAMTALVTLVALNFFGLFEVTLGSNTMGRASELASREGSAGAFFNGVLTTVLATPCTAPFLAGAVGFAFVQPAGIILVIFVAVAVGLAAPYVVLSFQPGWIRFLPKPGAWMEKFKMAMGFPMLATALWLLSLIDAHFGDEGILWVGVFLVCVAVAAWVWGEFVQRGSRRRGLALALAVFFLAGGYVFALEMQLDWRHRGVPKGGSTLARKPGGIDWLPWSREAVAAARRESRPVLVDFTARWCPNCRVNKRTSIEISSVKQKLKEINAVTLVGDNTLFPPAIDEELKRFKRAGVPLVLVYPKDATKPPIVLPELLTPSIVLEALDQAVK